MSGSDWCLIESDPGVFTELIRGFGVSNVLVEELYCMSAQNFNLEQPIYGLIFLFKWKQADSSQESIVNDSRLERLFFAKQVINNACATQAILSILLNAPQKKSENDEEGVDLGETLLNFKEFSKEFDPTMKGLALNNSDIIRQVHNTFAKQQMFEFETKPAEKDDDVYHFISYIPFENRLYELDGLKEGPVDLGPIPENTTWIEAVRPIIEKRMERYNEGEIQFNLMAIVSDKMPQYKKKLAELEQELNSGMLTDALESQINELRQLIANQEAKLKAYQVENIRRKHNYLPLIIELLRTLGSQKKLTDLTALAKVRAAELRKRDGERKKAKA